MHANLLDSFWGECILASTYLINKMLVKILSWKTPFEALYGKAPTYDSLKVIGCLCYPTVTTPRKDKFSPRGIPCVFIGYPPNQKGIRLYDLYKKVVFYKRDVIFKEHLYTSDDEVVPEQTNLPTEPNTPKPNDAPRTDIEPKHVPIVSDAEETSFGTHNDTSQVPLRRSQRNTSTPVWLKDFVLPKLTASTVSKPDKPPLYSLFKEEDFKHFPASHVAFLAQVFDGTKLNSYQEACKSPQWVEAMEKELTALEQNETWELT
ncbi:retrovirus-related pol polyprotein from transposon TNT 1-94 [Tanacetum coccineum]|uniref:Retrovirus-related pol polyprotein from transposon TNT 1-94 n=1 Tax=Tanacetum coccineum TaxID=301880 RepID=A0ABQ5FI96_9ASTR